MRQIGDEVWYASCEWTKVPLTCPDCGGTGRIRCVMHDDAVVSVECRACQSGYDPPTGRLWSWAYDPKVTLVRITRIEIKPEGTEYGITDNYCADESCIFATEAEALAKSTLLVAEKAEAERVKIASKEKDTRSWAWNASYHRGEIRRMERDIAYHRAKLAVAAIKAKEPTDAQ